MCATSSPITTHANSARFFVVGEIDAVLEGWGVQRRVGEAD
jgi:hypothetical protein